MLGFIGTTISGGINAIGNIAASIAKPITTLASGFFPSPQKVTTISETTQSANVSGITYRPVAADAPSFAETAKWAADEWLKSPYEKQFAIPVKIAESNLSAQVVSGTLQQKTWGDNLSDIIRGAREGLVSVITEAGKIRTAVDEFVELWGLKPRETIQGTPREGEAEGRNEAAYNLPVTSGADLMTIGKAIGNQIIEQVKGLFNIGYEPIQAQPAFEIAPGISKKALITIAAVIGILLLIYFVGKRK